MHTRCHCLKPWQWLITATLRQMAWLNRLVIKLQPGVRLGNEHGKRGSSRQRTSSNILLQVSLYVTVSLGTVSACLSATREHAAFIWWACARWFWCTSGWKLSARFRSLLPGWEVGELAGAEFARLLPNLPEWSRLISCLHFQCILGGGGGGGVTAI